MAKTETTEAMELILTRQFYSSDYCLMHKEVGYGGVERCDLMGFSQHYRELICIELKQSVNDFHSKAKLTFLGNRNYYAMPYDIYEKVKDEIPKEIGVLTLPRDYILRKDTEMLIAKKCKHQMLHCDERTIMWEMQNSMKANPNQLTEALKLNIKSPLSRAYEDIVIFDWCKETGAYSENDINWVNKHWQQKEILNERY